LAPAEFLMRLRADNMLFSVKRMRRSEKPAFIRRLLRMNWLTLRDVLTIASRRPSTPELALEIARSDRWLPEHKVRLALVANPFTPASVVLPLMPTVLHGELVLLRASPHDSVRALASLLLEQVRGSWVLDRPATRAGRQLRVRSR
jgi:hypothetical protein